jgi:hypothetical protein
VGTHASELFDGPIRATVPHAAFAIHPPVEGSWAKPAGATGRGRQADVQFKRRLPPDQLRCSPSRSAPRNLINDGRGGRSRSVPDGSARVKPLRHTACPATRSCRCLPRRVRALAGSLHAPPPVRLVDRALARTTQLCRPTHRIRLPRGAAGELAPDASSPDRVKNGRVGGRRPYDDAHLQ